MGAPGQRLLTQKPDDDGEQGVEGAGEPGGGGAAGQGCVQGSALLQTLLKSCPLLPGPPALPPLSLGFPVTGAYAEQ